MRAKTYTEGIASELQHCQCVQNGSVPLYIYCAFFPLVAFKIRSSICNVVVVFWLLSSFFSRLSRFFSLSFFFFFWQFCYDVLWLHISFLLLWSQMMINLVAYNNTNLLSYSSRCQKFKNGSYGAKIRVVAGRPSSRGSKWKSIPCLFQLLETACIPWLLACSLYHFNLCLHCHISFSDSLLHQSHKIHRPHIESSQIIQYNLPSQEPYLVKWCKVTYSQVVEIRTWISLVDHDSAYQSVVVYFMLNILHLWVYNFH